VDEKKINKNKSFVISEVSRYDYIRRIKWAELVECMYILIQNLDGKQSMGQNICVYFDVKIIIKLDLGDTKCGNMNGICQNSVRIFAEVLRISRPHER
jgi:hypothetical protein